MRVKISHSIDFYRYRGHVKMFAPHFFLFVSDKILYQNPLRGYFLFNIIHSPVSFLFDPINWYSYISFELNAWKIYILKLYFIRLPFSAPYLFCLSVSVFLFYVHTNTSQFNMFDFWNVNWRKTSQQKKSNGQYHNLVRMDWHSQLRWFNCLRSLRKTNIVCYQIRKYKAWNFIWCIIISAHMIDWLFLLIFLSL